ncbi:MAG: DNA polymerase III subunit beta [Candidatus Liptonbacteria bacterium RIFOXYC1_FULL_36_8]|uniref:Beta sliding clamp n=3 Tax=Candidatus Liptoniibacteriota TaxID=1817909 RepID=A0A1G2CPV7_9BACT|nr:MAG: DNA polymerase III subunit beta [Candidatus Liptonbacteria bacterium RIFOXYB1_FULL_36_10]OGZ02952.1 MAG: DNA polymerase III subunit beta [Candidatus Liptonbacteria bacterium RIFOXYC1_FULL_36_8]OGZ03309.1 MAG: DNA polymerase III subunit beta [Candidatus Liptonbacteria bacterium RIFOXYD1_FULL_36_11]
MKIVLMKNNLKQALDAVSKISGENQNLPVLKNILIKTDGGKVRLSSTNLEVAISYWCQGKIIEEGEITVSSSIITSIVNNLSNEVINLEVFDKKLKVKTDNYEAEINTLPSDEFPIIPSIKGEAESFYIDIKTSVLKSAFTQVVSATHFSDLRPEINGILFNYEVGEIKLAGTDSFRLAEKTINSGDFKSNIEEGFKYIIPLKTVIEFLRILKDDGRVKIYFDLNQVLFKTEEIEIISRLIDGNFPDYEQIIPKQTVLEAVLEKGEFISALKVTSVFSSKVNDIKIKAVNGKILEFNSVTQGVGENKYIVPAKIKGDKLEVSFNWNYLLLGVRSLDKENVVFSLNNDDKPSILKALGDNSYFYILMPVKE